MKPEDWINAEDRKPALGQLILAHHKSGSYWAQEIRSLSLEEDYDYWTPIAPPPKPDPFEAWWKQTRLTTHQFTSIRVWCKEAWDAAIASNNK